MGWVALLCTLLGFAPAPTEPTLPSDPSSQNAEHPRVSALPLPGPPSETPPPGAAKARDGEARKLRMRGVEPEDVGLFVPRAVLLVPRFALTSVFMPVSAFMGVFDDRVVARMRRGFYWNRAETFGWRPTFAFQGGYGFSAGARVFHKNFAGNKETIEADALAGGIYFQAYQLRIFGDRLGGSRWWLDLRGRYDASPRLVFQGYGHPGAAREGETNLGPRDADVRTRYSQQRGLAAARFGYGIGPEGRKIRPGLGFVFNHRRFGPERRREGSVFGSADDYDGSIEEKYDVDQIVGFNDGVDVMRLDAQLELDFENNPGRPSRGFRWISLAGGAPPQMRGVAFPHYGTELIGYLDVFRASRVLVMRVGLEAVHGPDARIPFSELPRLGGPLRLRGYRFNRFRDKKAAFATLEYRYPIHDIVGGHVFVDAGRVAATYRELLGAEVDPWRIGGGAGFTIRTLERWFVRIDVSYGEDFLVFFSTDPLQAFADRHLLEL